MQELSDALKILVESMGFREVSAEHDPAYRKVSIVVGDDPNISKYLPTLVVNLNHVARLISKRLDLGPVVVDVNNYRKERDILIIDLAKAAARKAVATKEAVQLPAMNAYERRLVHTELSIRPDVTTESSGEGKERFVVVKITE
ncbi:MAG: hypothetical protein HYS87_01385 [Candidatus Colwellbacteria bacterium]|nr:hypothetical protein [Candidatus Colwellbacteria bacterium]